MAYFFLLIPPTLAAAVAAVAVMPVYAARRREELTRSRVGRGWLLRTLVFDRSKLGHALASDVPSPSGSPR
jgi:hypothetical protein